jgi:dTDP-D-glucose 4,6-dehydratase
VPASSAPTSSRLARLGGETVVNLDKLTYAGNLGNLASLKGDARHIFVQGDIGDAVLVGRLLTEHRPRAVINFAAESHVDRSIHGAAEFIETNVVGTFRLLQETLGYWRDTLGRDAGFRFLHVSTDEVYGSLGADDRRLHRDDAVPAQQRRTRHRRPRPIISCARGITRTDYRC